MPKYKIKFNAHIFVEADTEEDALEMFEDGEIELDNLVYSTVMSIEEIERE